MAPVKVHAKHLLRGVLFGALIAAFIIGIPLLIFLVVFGGHRFVLDFWPLDNSRVGPNIVASFVLAVLVIGHNEYRTAVKDVEKGDTIVSALEEMEGEILHPVEAGEQSVADDVRAKEDANDQERQ